MLTISIKTCFTFYASTNYFFKISVRIDKYFTSIRCTLRNHFLLNTSHLIMLLIYDFIYSISFNTFCTNMRWIILITVINDSTALCSISINWVSWLASKTFSSKWFIKTTKLNMFLTSSCIRVRQVCVPSKIITRTSHNSNVEYLFQMISIKYFSCSSITIGRIMISYISLFSYIIKRWKSIICSSIHTM